MTKRDVMKLLHKGLIVSCQALAHEPLHSSFIMGRLAVAAKEGGAKGIRANSPQDIMEIRRVVDLPIIGLHKVDYPGTQVYITPTLKEVDALVEAGADIIAIDATKRPRVQGESLESFFGNVRKRYPNQLFMADTSCYEEGVIAQNVGFDMVSTTMAGYTPYTQGRELPDIELMRRFVQTLQIPVIAEGGIGTPQQLQTAMQTGVWAAVVGTAITRPQTITKSFVDALV